MAALLPSRLSGRARRCSRPKSRIPKSRIDDGANSALLFGGGQARHREARE
jgi:hypothetical protein